MTELKEKVTVLNTLIFSGDTLKAMELFYADDVEMQENDEPQRKGKKLCIDTEKENLQKVKAVESILLNQAIDEEKNIVFSEWEILCSYKENSKFLLREVSVQHWVAGQIIKEKFYYKSFRKIE
jgi:hypothetical protein